MSQETKGTTHDTLMEQLTAELDDLQGWIKSRPAADAVEAVHAKKKLEGVVQRTAALIAEYEAFLVRFRPVLERMQTLDADAILIGRSPYVLGDPAAEATQLLRRVTDAIDKLSGIPARADAWTRAKEGAKLSRRLEEEVQEHVGGAEVARRRVETLLERVRRFMIVQREKEGSWG